MVKWTAIVDPENPGSTHELRFKAYVQEHGIEPEYLEKGSPAAEDVWRYVLENFSDVPQNAGYPRVLVTTPGGAFAALWEPTTQELETARNAG